MDAPDAQRRKCRTVDAMEPVFFYSMPETFYTELLAALDIVGVIDCCVGEGSCALACSYLGIAYKATLGQTHVAELHWLPRCCSDKDASILVAPDLAAKKAGSIASSVRHFLRLASGASTSSLPPTYPEIFSFLTSLPAAAAPEGSAPARGLFATGVSLALYRWYCDLVLADDQQGLRLPDVAHTAHALVLGVHAVHIFRHSERLGNRVLAETPCAG